MSYTTTPMMVQIDKFRSSTIAGVSGFMLIPTQIGPGQYGAASSNPIRMFCDNQESIQVYFGQNGSYTQTVPPGTWVELYGYIENTTYDTYGDDF